MIQLLEVKHLPTIIGVVFLVAVVEGILSELQSNTLAGKIAIRFLWVATSMIITILVIQYLKEKKMLNI